MSNVVSFQGRKLRINGDRIEYFHEGAGQWMDDGPAPSGAEDLYVNFGTLYVKSSDGVKYKRSEYGNFSPVTEKAKKEKSNSGGGGGGNKVLSAIWWIIKLPFRLIWWIIKSVF